MNGLKLGRIIKYLEVEKELIAIDNEVNQYMVEKD